MKLKTLPILFLLIFFASIPGFAQLGTAGINGKVFDSSGATIGGATITVKNRDTSQTREVISNETGLFTIKSLPPGTYLLTLEAPNFAKTMIDNLMVRVGEDVSIRGVLKPASTNEVVEVKANEAQGVDVTSTQVNSFIDTQTIENLPLNGRNFLDLAFLLPGNAPAPNYDPIKNNTIDVVSAGQSGRGGNISIDGSDNNNDGVGGNLQNLPQDAVQEFQIVTNQPESTIGRTGSSAINIVTKSGTNDFHGTGGVFFRNARLSAVPSLLDRTIVNSLGRPDFDRQQYTLSLGGPIKRDRAWFFSALEYRNQDAIILTGLRDVAGQRIVNTFSTAPLDDFLFTTRGDLQLSSKDRMTFRYALQNQDAIESAFQLRPTSTAEQRESATNNYQSFVYNYVRTFSTRLLNDFTFQENNYISNLKDIVSTSGPEFLFPSIQAGSNDLLPTRTRQNRFQLRNNLSLIAGSHVFKFGGEYQRIDLDFLLDIFSRGSIVLAEDFATVDRNGDGVINDFDILIDSTLQGFTPQKVVPYDNDYISFYGQDEWKIRPNLTLNYGLRYELESDSKNTSSVNQLPALLKPFIPAGKRKRDTDNFGPRIGLNWDLFKNGRTSLHASYGIFYDRIIINTRDLEKRIVLVAARLGSEVDDNNMFIPGTPTLSNPFVGDIIADDPQGFFLLDKSLESPMVQQINFGIRQEILRDLVVSIDGIHTFGTKFVILRNLGAVFNPAIGGPAAVLNVEPSAKNWYDGLLINVEKKPSKRFGFLASYTLSKAFNYSNDDQFIVPDFAPIDDNNNLGLEKAEAHIDQRHRFTFAGLFQAPLGINVSPIFTLASDLPFDILVPDGTTRIPLLQRNAGGRQFRNGAQLNAFLRQINAAGGLGDQGPLPLVRDNLKFGDGFSSFDLRVSKLFKFNDRLSLQGIAEVFNLFNVTNVRGISNLAVSGFQNALVRDSGDPNDPGFLRSSSFGSKVQTGGGVFGTGGPRAFQFALRVNF